jgi:hypothetical protein
MTQSDIKSQFENNDIDKKNIPSEFRQNDEKFDGKNEEFENQSVQKRNVHDAVKSEKNQSVIKIHAENDENRAKYDLETEQCENINCDKENLLPPPEIIDDYHPEVESDKPEVPPEVNLNSPDNGPIWILPPNNEDNEKRKRKKSKKKPSKI